LSHYFKSEVINKLQTIETLSMDSELVDHQCTEELHRNTSSDDSLNNNYNNNNLNQSNDQKVSKLVSDHMSDLKMH